MLILRINNKELGRAISRDSGTKNLQKSAAFLKLNNQQPVRRFCGIKAIFKGGVKLTYSYSCTAICKYIFLFFCMTLTSRTGTTTTTKKKKKKKSRERSILRRQKNEG